MIKKIIACSDIHIRNLKRMDETWEMLGSFIEACKEYKELLENYSPEGGE